MPAVLRPGGNWISGPRHCSRLASNRSINCLSIAAVLCRSATTPGSGDRGRARAAGVVYWLTPGGPASTGGVLTGICCIAAARVAAENDGEGAAGAGIATGGGGGGATSAGLGAGLVPRAGLGAGLVPSAGLGVGLVPSAGLRAGLVPSAGLGAALVLGVGLGAGEASLTGGKGGLMFNVIDLRGSSAGAGVVDALAFFFPFPFVAGSSFGLGNTPVEILVFQA
jgi:hypothetical protein